MRNFRFFAECVSMYVVCFIAIIFIGLFGRGNVILHAAFSFSLIAVANFAFVEWRGRKLEARRSLVWRRKLSAARVRQEAIVRKRAAFDQKWARTSEAASYLTPGDFSILVAAKDKRDERAGFVTQPNSPIHLVLSMLEQLELAKLADIFPEHDMPAGIELLTFELTPLGVDMLPRFLEHAEGVREKHKIIARWMVHDRT